MRWLIRALYRDRTEELGHMFQWAGFISFWAWFIFDPQRDAVCPPWWLGPAFATVGVVLAPEARR